MIVRLVSASGIDAREQFAAHPVASADAEQGHDAESPQHGRADHARELAAVLDVAADDQPIAARQAEHIGESEPVLDAAGRRARDRRTRPGPRLFHRSGVTALRLPASRRPSLSATR